jgi:signal peptidase I
MNKKFGFGRKPKVEKKPETFVQSLISWVNTILGAIVVVMIVNGIAVASFVVPTGSMEETVMTGDFLFVNKFLYGPSTPQVIPFVNVPLPFYKFPGIKDPEKGDVIVFIFPGNRDEVEPREFQYYLKRAAAVAGDTLEIRNKALYVNGVEEPLSEHARYDRNVPLYPRDRFQTFPAGANNTRDDFGPIRIPAQGDVIELTPENITQWDVFIIREGNTEVTSDGKNVYINGEAVTSYTVKRDYCFGLGDNRDHSLDSRYFGFIPYENVVGTPMIVYWSWDTNTPLSQFGKKLKSVRFGRLGTIIR